MAKKLQLLRREVFSARSCSPVAVSTSKWFMDSKIFFLPLLKSYLVVLFCHSPNTFESLFLKVASFLAFIFGFLLQCKHSLIWLFEPERQGSNFLTEFVAGRVRVLSSVTVPRLLHSHDARRLPPLIKS